MSAGETPVPDQEISTLLRTKLYMPRLVADLVERPHLHSRLDRGLDRSLTLVSAPAGYGKTTLIVHWLRSLQSEDHRFQERVAWLSLDRHDNDILEFLNYFAAAIQTIFPTACPQTANMDQLPHLPHLPPLSLVAAVVLQKILSSSNLRRFKPESSHTRR